MEEYKQILKRIIEIIELSKKSKNIINILNFSIDTKYQNEFNELLILERSKFIILTNKKPFINNLNQIENSKYTLNEDKLKLNKILSQCIGYQNKVIEYYGFFILKEDIDEFKELCKKSNIQLKDNLETLCSEQQQRINILLNNLQKEKEKSLTKLINAEYFIKEANSIEEIIEFLKETKNVDVSSLKALIPSIGILEYNNLIDELFKRQIISFEDYKKHINELLEVPNLK